MSSVRCRGLSHVYGSRRHRVHALRDVSFDAVAGEIVGLVGPNGAGKTTLLDILAGELCPTTGEVVVAGQRAGTLAARRAVGYAPDPPLAPPELTGLEWLGYLAAHRATSARERVHLVRAAVEFAGLEDFVGRRTGGYSHGMAQRLGLATAAISRGSVVLLDEALSGVDPLVHRRLREQIARLAATHKLVILSSHDLAAIERLATRVIILWGGRVHADVGTGALLKERVAELALDGASIKAVGWLLERFVGAARTGQGVAVPLTQGLTVEAILAACRDARIPIAGTRVRYRALEDLLLAAEQQHRGRE